ncbi:MAG: glycosyltransferase family 39 protein [Caldilineales bacterium]|nr:glycosyltransferase family 39 protein [Caldilineales bacterium]
MSSRSKWLVGLLLAVILLISLALRTYNVDWAEGQLPHPDERSTIAFYAPSIQWPTKPGTFFDPRQSTLNPFWDVNGDHRRSFTYGHFPLYLLVAAGHLTVKAAPLAESLGVPEDYVNMMRIAAGSPGYAWVGRWIMAIADTITLLYLFLLGRRLYGRWAGLLAAALGGFTVLQIQLAHFFAVDPISTTFTVAAIYHATRMVDKKNWTQAILTGIMAGLAIASKFSAAPILAAPVVAGLLIWWRHERQGGEGWSGIVLTAVALVVAGLVFAATSPFVLLDFENFRLAVIEEQGAMVRGIADFPFTRQYRGTTPYLYFIQQQIQWGMSYFLGIAGWLAFLWAIVKALRLRAQPGELITLSWLIPYFLITGSFLAKFNRYMAPVVPLLALLAAGMLWTFAVWWGKRSEVRGQKPEIGEEQAASGSGQVAGSDGALVVGEDEIEDSNALALNEAATFEDTQADLRSLTSDLDNAQPGTPNPELRTPPPSRLDRWLQLWDSPQPPAPATSAARRTNRAFSILSAIVLLPTILWALAFVHGVYGREHTFITASKWMYENIPDDSVWITEHWEEGMPLQLPIPDGYPGAHGWQNVVMPMYEEDNAAKYEILRQNMREGDYYVLATKRLYGALPKLPERYPMSTKFYDLLFDGELGYELAAEFTAYPNLFGIDIPDQSADESFWVYDHPRVLIYQKVRELSDQEWDALLGGTWESAIPGYTGQRPQDRGGEPPPPDGEKAPPDLLLDQPVGELPDVGQVAWAPWSTNSFVSLLVWWLALLLVSVIAWPLAFVVFPHLRDRGYGFSRALGLVLVAWIAWIIPSTRILTNTLLPTLIALVILLLISFVSFRSRRTEIRAFVRSHHRLLLLSEGVFTGAFLFFIFIRILNPDLWQPWQGGEKLMEFAFLNAILRTPYFPAIDPYFAGGYINYYYYGYQVLASLIKLTGITSSIAFNLAIPTLFALTASGIFALVYSLIPKRKRVVSSPWWGRGTIIALLGVFFVVVMGNLEGGLIFFRQIGERAGTSFNSNIPFLQSGVQIASGIGKVIGGQADLPGYNFWTPSRVLPFTINEFPFWSYLFADLHPHMIGIPFTVLFLALCYNLVAGFGKRWGEAGRWGGFWFLAFLPLTLGAIAVINTWDLPTYLGIAVLAWLVREWKGSGKIRILPTIVFVAGLGALTFLLYSPFFRHYTTVFNTGLGLTYIKTEAGPWLRIWGFFIFILLTYVLVELRRKPGDVAALCWMAGILNHFQQPARFLDKFSALTTPDWHHSFGLTLTGIAALLSIILAFLGYGVIGLLLTPLALLFLFLFRRTTTAESQFRVILFFTATLVLVGVEVFYLKDFLCGCGEGIFNRQHGDYYRMNTLFKFYTQVWVMFGIAAAAALPDLLDAVAKWVRGWRWLWNALFVILLALGLFFPILGTASRVDDRFPGERPARNTLDGMAFMTVGKYFWPDGSNEIDLSYDYEAIRWLQENVTGTPVLAEAPASWYPVNGQNAGYDYYRAGGLRVTSMTGLPGFLGQHQGEQRWGWQTGPREQIGREFWETTDVGRMQQIADEIGVEYVYVGQLERTLFSPEQLAKFDVLVDSGQAEIVFENDGVTIYQLQ